MNGTSGRCNRDSGEAILVLQPMPPRQVEVHLQVLAGIGNTGAIVDEEPYIKDDHLKPCPFCGGEADVCKGSKGPDYQPWWYVECVKCSATCESVETWNARVFGSGA